MTRLAIIGAVVAASAFAIAIAAGPTTSAQVRSSTPLTGCRAVVRYGDGQGATGSIYAAFTVTVRARHRCSLIDFPTIQLLGRHGQTLPTHARHVGYQLAGVSFHRVLLWPGHPGYFDLIYRTFDDRGHYCPPVAPAIRVRLPRQASTQTVRVDGHNPTLRVFDPCNGTFIVTPVAITR